MASAGHEHSAVLTEAGEVYTMGEGSRGQLGHNELGCAAAAAHARACGGATRLTTRLTPLVPRARPP